jgi:hypothetical protein
MQKNPDSRDLLYLQFVTDRMHGHSDKQIANKLVSGPPTLLYRQLANDGYPVCPACGAAPIDKKHSCKSKRQPGLGTGKSSELPDPSLASELFADTLRSLLARVADIEPRHESSQDGRIVGTDTFVGSLYLERRYERKGKVVENFSQEQWNELCARHGQNPTVEGFWVEGDGLKRAAGAARHPAELLTTLIGVYALADGDMDQLLETLYPGTPTQDTLEAIRKRVDGKKKPDNMDGLKTLARQLATLVRGQELSGAPPPSLTPVEHDAACYITMLREEKFSDEEIEKKLSNHRMADGSGLSKAEIQRLGNLRLRYYEDYSE